MTRLEKVINDLDDAVGYAAFTKCKFARVEKQTAADALELLKEREPVKPKKSPLSMKNRFFGAIYNCGFCGSRLQGVAKYCVQCGRAVKWDE